MEKIFSELNREVVCRLSDSFPAEGLVTLEPPKYRWQPYSEELAVKLKDYPKKERSLYTRAVNEVLRGLKLSTKIENMHPKWTEHTPLEQLRNLDLESCATLPRVSKSAARRAIELVG